MPIENFFPSKSNDFTADRLGLAWGDGESRAVMVAFGTIWEVDLGPEDLARLERAARRAKHHLLDSAGALEKRVESLEAEATGRRGRPAFDPDAPYDTREGMDASANDF